MHALHAHNTEGALPDFAILPNSAPKSQNTLPPRYLCLLNQP